MRKTAPTICLLLLSAFAFGRSHTTSMHGQVRTYFVAADEVDWEYAPSRVDQITGEKFHFQDDPGSAGMLDPNTTMYRKAVFREYTDATFRTPKARPDAINGYSYGAAPMLTMHKGERVRWYLFANPNEEEAWDIHTAHWHGQTAIVGHMRTDMVMLNPMTSTVADMVPDNPGIWLLHCHMPGHASSGMRARFEVLQK